MDISDTSDYSGSNFSSLSCTLASDELSQLQTPAGKNDTEYKNNLDSLEKAIELKFYKKFDKLMRLNVQLESQLSAANKFINSFQNDTILESELKKLNFDLNFRISQLECEVKSLKCDIESNEKILDSLRCENEEKSIVIDMKSNSVVGLKNKIVELHLQLLQLKQTNLKSENEVVLLTKELNSTRKSEEWYKKSLSDCRIQKGSLLEEIANLKFRIVAKDRDIQVQKLKSLEQIQDTANILTNKLLEFETTCKRQHGSFDRICSEKQNLLAENVLLQSKLKENQLKCLREKDCEVFVFPPPEGSFNETDMRHFSCLTHNNSQTFQSSLNNSKEGKRTFGEDLFNNSEVNSLVSSPNKCKNWFGKNQNGDETTAVMNASESKENLPAETIILENPSDCSNVDSCESDNFVIGEKQKYEETIAELGFQYMGLQNEVESLKDSNSKYFSELQNLQVRFQEVQESSRKKENRDLKLEKLCLQTQLQSLQTEIENLTQKHNHEMEKLMENLETKKYLVEKFENENSELKNTVMNEKQMHRETVAELGLQFDDLQYQIESLHYFNNKYQANAETFQKDIEELKNYIDTSESFMVSFKEDEQLAKQDLQEQILDLHHKVKEYQSLYNTETVIKQQLLDRLKTEEETQKDLQKIIAELKCTLEVKESVISHATNVEREHILKIESLQTLVDELTTEINIKNKRSIAGEEMQKELEKRIGLLQQDIFNSETLKQVQIENIQVTSKELAQSNDSIMGLVTTLKIKSDATTRKLENENLDLRHYYEMEIERLREEIGRLMEIIQENECSSKSDPSVATGSGNILLDVTITDVPNLVKGEDAVFLKAEVRRLSTLCKAKNLENEENHKRYEKCNHALLNEVKEYKIRCAKIQKEYKQLSEELNGCKFFNQINKQKENLKFYCDNCKTLLHGINERVDELKKTGVSGLLVKTLNRDETKNIEELQEKINILHNDLVVTRGDKYFLQRLCKDLKFSLVSSASQTKVLKKQNQVLKSMSFNNFSNAMSTVPSPNRFDDTHVQELIKASRQNESPFRKLDDSISLFKKEIDCLQNLVL